MNKIILIIVIVVVILIAIFAIQNKEIFVSVNNSGNNINNNNTNNTTTISGNKILDLSNQGLTSIPSYVFNQTGLEELNVSHNYLTGAIQSQIGQLKNLKILDASYSQMTGVPAEIGQLRNLQSLDLSYNQLTGLPNELGNLQNLKILNLTGNNYSQQDLDYIHSKLPANTIIIAK